MELRQITTFIKVAQLGSFSKAADSLGYSQSAVTVQIRQLEDELGTRLFDRMGKHISLTDPGSQFLNRAYDIINEVNKARLSVADTGDLHGSLHIGTISSLCDAKLPALLKKYWGKHPNVTVRVTTAEPEELIYLMERGDVDLIYILDEPRYNNNWRKLMEQREDVVFVASSDLARELNRPEGLKIGDLFDMPFYLTERNANYRRVLDRFLESKNVSLTPALECSDTSFIIKMLEINRGVSFLPVYAVSRSIEQGRLAILNVTDYRASLYRQIFSHKEKWHTREMNEFIEIAEKTTSTSLLGDV